MVFDLIPIIWNGSELTKHAWQDCYPDASEVIPSNAFLRVEIKYKLRYLSMLIMHVIMSQDTLEY